jgi:hypothetical protein
MEGQGLAKVLPTLGLQAPFSDEYRVSASSSEPQSGIQMESLEAAAADGRVVRLQKFGGVSPDQGNRFIQERVFQLKSIYEPHREPYFAVLTKTTACPKQFKLVQQADVNTASSKLEIYSLYANDRLTMGACTNEQATYRAFVALLECSKSQSVFVVESFVPTRLSGDADVSGIKSIACLQAP